MHQLFNSFFYHFTIGKGLPLISASKIMSSPTVASIFDNGFIKPEGTKKKIL